MWRSGMRVDEYTAHDAIGLAELVRRGDVSAAELYATALEAIARVEPRLNAVVDGPWERPLDHAADGPFAGVPFVLKDLGAHAAGIPVKAGSRLSGDGVVYETEGHLIRR